MFKEPLAEKIQRTERQLKELAIRLEGLERAYQQILEEEGLHPDQLQTEESPPADLLPELWEELENEHKQWEEQLTHALERISHPSSTKQSFSQQATIQSHWLFVR